jgi:hypothetical protein
MAFINTIRPNQASGVTYEMNKRQSRDRCGALLFHQNTVNQGASLA